MIFVERLQLDTLQIENADTGTTQYATPSGGSKTVPTEAPAVRAAAVEYMGGDAAHIALTDSTTMGLGLVYHGLRVPAGSQLILDAHLINASRGMVVDDVSLRDHLLSGHIAGAALDVFPVEPKAQGDTFESVLRGVDNVILTPHVGGSTQEAQAEIGWFVAGKLSGFALEGNTSLSVNLPAVVTPPLETGHRLGFLHHNVPGVLARFNAVFAEHEDNVTGQHLTTTGGLGYVVTDASEPLPADALAELRSWDECLWARTW